jgi:uncharacterized membrane protein
MPQEYLVIQIQEALPEGMLFVRINYILTTMIRAPVLAACFFLLTLSSFVHYASSTPKALDFTIYAEGSAHIFYQTDVDPESPDFTLNLYGKSIENLVVQDENGTLLSSRVNGTSITVETLGASTIKLDYDTPDLVSKNGKTWTFQVNSTIDYSVLMPKNTVIVGMSASPLNMQIVENQSLISFPGGLSEINYVFGVLGTSQTASLAIQKAQDFINTVISSGIQTPNATLKLEEAKSDFDQGKYSDAESLANSAKNIALQEQQASLSEPKTSSGNFIIPILIAGGIGVGATGFIFIKKHRSKSIVIPSELSKNNYVSPDKEKIFKIKPELRKDDKEIVTFISEKGGQVYESELRKKFLMPRTTMWRAVKRLEREEIIDIEKVDKQNLIKLRKIEDDKK